MSVVLVDVRARAAYEAGHIPAAVHLDPDDDLSAIGPDPAIGGRHPLPDEAELGQVFALIAQEHQDRGQALPKDTTEIVHA